MTTVLFVDGDEAIRDLAADLLEDLGIQTQCAASSRDVLQLIDKGLVFHLAIVDAHVSHGINGVELLHMLRAGCPNMPLILLSTDHTGAQETRGINAAFLSKPFNRQQLLRVIAKVMAGKEKHHE